MSGMVQQTKQPTKAIAKALGCSPIALFCFFFLLGSCSSGPEDKPLPKQVPAQSAGYEIPGVLKAEEVLPSDLLEGDHYKVNDEVVTYGFTNHFSVTSPFGQFDAEGEDKLRIVIQEIQALAAIQDMKKSKVFIQAVKNAISSPFKPTKELIIHPVDTISGVPQGAWEYMNRIDAGGSNGKEKRSENIAKDLSALSEIKRKFAYKFGVDPYSSNRVLQKSLNSLSWAGLGGGISVTLLNTPISEPEEQVVRSSTLTRKVNELLRDNAPEDLRKINEELLVGMGVAQADIGAFLYHPWYSPRHQTLLIHALAEMEGVKNRDQFIKLAATAGYYEADAFLFQRMAEMMAGYNRHIGGIKELIPLRQRLIACYTAEEALVFVLPADLVHWTQQASQSAQAVAELKSGDRSVSRVEVWLSGQFTAKSKQEIEGLGVEIHEKAYEQLMPIVKKANAGQPA